MCMMVYSIHATKIRTIPRWIVPEKAKFSKAMIRKNNCPLARKLFQFLLFIDVFSQFRTTEKSGRKNKFLNYFMFISKPGFEQQKTFSLFLRNGWADRAENFSTNTRCKSGCFFFLFPRNLVSVKFVRPYKIYRIKKTLVFDKVFSILLLLTCENDIFSKRKKTGTSVCV